MTGPALAVAGRWTDSVTNPNSLEAKVPAPNERAPAKSLSRIVTVAVLRISGGAPRLTGVSVSVSVRLPSCLELPIVGTLKVAVATPALNVRLPEVAR